ncbi:MAG: thioredoxin family protein [Candidatus Altiarchaeota archaeon]
MAELKIEVFTNPRCPHCPSAVKATKELLRENKKLKERVKWSELSTATSKGRKKATTYGIRSVPTIVLTDKNGEKGAIAGAPSQRKYLETVYKMLGEEPPEEITEEGKKEGKPGLLERLFG